MFTATWVSDAKTLKINVV